ncbi:MULTISPECIES: hypothetical protein [unclassified Streptomyces]|uniref:hypothetical protein n=1 Tax=unclassified Streptomyces TaxID=2593676 RepID=UPI00093F3E49|nr:hypothetical protein [Streptomyces sp. TSRI0281]OKI48042.1 hypothetical protein A6A29_03020 [Streptomyces sp. TSRI0281]
MDTQQISVPPPAPSSGVVHLNVRLTERFTIISNALSQHGDLSLVAIGLSTYIQSLPAGTKVGIKVLAERFKEGETCIAAALRELEVHGFLRRVRFHLRDGRIATRTESYNLPEHDRRPQEAPKNPRNTSGPGSPKAPKRASPPRPAAAPAPTPVREPTPAPTSVREPAPAPTPRPAAAPAPTSVRESAPAPTSVRKPAPASRLVPPPTAPKPPPPPLPVPQALTPQLHRAAADLLAGLPRTVAQLVLSERDVQELTPGAAAWLERGATPATLRAALTGDLPVPLKHPAKLLRHRLIALLPPLLPTAPPVVPMQNCDDCDRAFRSPVAGPCRDCRGYWAEALREPDPLSA